MTITEQSFLADVADHRMVVIRDEGVYRHVRFTKPESGDMRFDLITWPGYLCYTGDMGTYVFWRLDDMFEFFRSNHRGSKGGVHINPGYWAEKVEAVDRCDGVEEYSADKFREWVEEWLDDIEASEDVRESVKEDVLAFADDGEDEARRAMRDFEIDDREAFPDFWEVDLKVYARRFLWCCYALSWGTAKYYEAKEKTAA